MRQQIFTSWYSFIFSGVERVALRVLLSFVALVDPGCMLTDQRLDLLACEVHSESVIVIEAIRAAADAKLLVVIGHAISNEEFVPLA